MADKEAETSLNNLVASTPLEKRERFIPIGLHLIKTEVIKLAKDYTRRELDNTESIDLDKRFTYHSPKEGQPEVYKELRSMGRDLAAYICSTQEVSRERSLALTKLEECIMWANAGIARNT